MTVADLPFELTTATDEVTPLRDGTVARQRKYVFYLGKFGPFTERFDIGTDTPAAVQGRVRSLQQHLIQLHS